jgi:hypothetical protein
MERGEHPGLEHVEEERSNAQVGVAVAAILEIRSR